MCFSATASFTASAVLGTVGVATIAKTKNRKAWMLSAVPLLFLWPVYTPLMILMLEPNKIRRIILSLFCVSGAAVGTIFYANYLRQPEAAWVVNRCLYYPNQIFHPDLLKYLYILVTGGAGFISSQTIVKLFCLMVLVGSIITYYFYAVNFTSVWCFFAAATSVMLFFQPQKQLKG